MFVKGPRRVGPQNGFLKGYDAGKLRPHAAKVQIRTVCERSLSSKVLHGPSDSWMHTTNIFYIKKIAAVSKDAEAIDL